MWIARAGPPGKCLKGLWLLCTEEFSWQSGSRGMISWWRPGNTRKSEPWKGGELGSEPMSRHDACSPQA